MKRRTLLRGFGSATTAGLLGGTATVTAATGSFTREYYGDESYLKYVPSGVGGSSSVPLLTMLHGCAQSPGQFANETGMNAVAESETFIVVYPDQMVTENPTQCWNWFDHENHVRGSGETALIANITQATIAEHAIDPHRVYVAGFSAGAAMVPDLLAAYPDVFAAGGIHSGLEYAAAESASGAGIAMVYGGPNPIEQGTDAYRLMNDNGVASRIPTIVFHGTDDAMIDPVNGQQAAIQAVRTNDLASSEDFDTDPDAVRSGTTDTFDYSVYEYHDPNNTVVEQWLVQGMGHAWSGGSTVGEYTAPDGPDASRILWEFFDSHPDTRNNDEFEGFCGTDYNYQHEDAGRAIYQGGYYATGSGDYLGLSSQLTTLKETREGYFEQVRYC